MSGDAPDPRPPAGTGEAHGAEPSAEESLDEALGHLERMLERRDGDEAPPPAASEPPTRQQYEIPLLDDVVLPGGEAAAAPARTAVAFEENRGEIRREESDELSRLVAARLASEIEIIVNDLIERAIGEALAGAQARIRDHLAIVLPEIVDELRHVRGDEES